MAIDGGPAVRGNKLLAWRIPPVVKLLEDNDATNSTLNPPSNSKLIPAQRALLEHAHKALRAVSQDVQNGLHETVGINAQLVIDECAAMMLEIPHPVTNENPDADTSAVEPERIAQAIDLENVEAWCDENRIVRVGISPWYTTKDVDQTVLAITKVVHVLLGLHASDTGDALPNKRFKLFYRLTRSALEIANLQRDLPRK